MMIKGRMTTAVVAAAVLLVAVSQAASQSNKSDRERMGLLGPVKSVTTETESPGKPRTKIQTAIFNATGKKIEEINYSESGAIANRVTFTYDARGNLIEERRFDINGAGLGKIKFHYDAGGRETQRLSYSADGQLSSTTTFVYDSSGRLSEETHKGAKDNWFDGAFQYVYDEQGRLINKKSNRTGALGSARSDGSFRVVATYQYDDRGFLVEETETGITGALRTRYSYDSNGKMTRKVGGLVPRTVDYDDKGNPIKEYMEGFRYGSANPETSYKYEFDSKGNWVQQIITQTTVKERTERAPGTSLSYPSRQPLSEVIQTRYRTVVYC